MAHTKLTDEFQAEAIKLARMGAPQKIIAERLNVAPGTLNKWLKWGSEWEPKDGDECPEDREPFRAFREAFHHAQTDPVMLCEATWLKAVQGTPAQPAQVDQNGKVIVPAVPAIPPDPKAAERWLKAHRQDLYREGVDLNLSGTVEVSKVTDALQEYDEAINRALGGGDTAGDVTD